MFLVSLSPSSHFSQGQLLLKLCKTISSVSSFSVLFPSSFSHLPFFWKNVFLRACRHQVGPSSTVLNGMSSCPHLLRCCSPSLASLGRKSSYGLKGSLKVPILLSSHFPLCTSSLGFPSYSYSCLWKVNPDGLTQWSW